jgi:hypothetical protein
MLLCVCTAKDQPSRESGYSVSERLKSAIFENVEEREICDYALRARFKFKVLPDIFSTIYNGTADNTQYCACAAVKISLLRKRGVPETRVQIVRFCVWRMAC